MASPAFDDGIEKLEGFCTLLGQTSAALLREGEVLDARGDSIEKTESEARQRCEQVAERLGAALDDVTDAEEDAVEQTDRLGEAAQDLAGNRLSAAEESLESAGEAFEERAGQDRAGLEKEVLDLFEAGFAALGAAIDEMETEVARAGEAARQALEALGQGIGETGAHVKEDGAKTVAALEEAERGVAEDDAHELERQVAAHVDLWVEELPEAVRAECASVAVPLEALYREWEAEVVAEGDELSEGVAGLLEDAADIVANEAGQPLAAAVEETTNGSFAALAGQREALLPALEEGEPASEAAAALVDDLSVARRLVAEIERLLNALAE